MESAANRTATETHWAKHRGQNHLKGVTIFNSYEGFSPEDLLIAQMDSIDLHHGEYSSHSPYDTLEVVGAKFTAEIEEALSNYGFDQFSSSPTGFSVTMSARA
ncbi:MAG: hypothetical protein PW792_05635 [Acidobacteriaceae bacterium]|nr:hypothetical protein [Acidobacteriaceae bacterium]